MNYKLPNPETNPTACLVLSYKTLKGIEYDNRVWDKTNWGRCMRSASNILESLKTLKNADRCLLEISKKMEDSNLTWTLETIERHAHEWATKNIKRENEHGLSARARFFADLAKSRTEGEGAASGEESAGEAISAMLRSHAAPATDRNPAVDPIARGRNVNAKGPVVESKNDPRP